MKKNTKLKTKAISLILSLNKEELGYIIDLAKFRIKNERDNRVENEVRNKIKIKE